MNKNVKSIELSDKTSEFKDHKTYIQANHKHRFEYAHTGTDM